MGVVVISVYAVVPAERVEVLARRGWKLGRQNGVSGTVTQAFTTLEAAEAAANRLPHGATWSIEQ